MIVVATKYSNGTPTVDPNGAGNHRKCMVQSVEARFVVPHNALSDRIAASGGQAISCVTAKPKLIRIKH